MDAQVPLEAGWSIQEEVVGLRYFPEDAVGTLLKYRLRNALAVLFGYYANGHNEIWKSSDVNSRVEYLLELAIR